MIPFNTRRSSKIHCVYSQVFSLNATTWFRGSASEPTELQALPAELPYKQDSELDWREAETRKQYLHRQEPGNERFYSGDPREASYFPPIL